MHMFIPMGGMTFLNKTMPIQNKLRFKSLKSVKQLYFVESSDVLCHLSVQNQAQYTIQREAGNVS